MNVFQGLFLLILLSKNILAHDIQVSESCLKGIEDALKCCALVPTAEYVNLKHPADCHVFYHCESGIPVLKRCPDILQWSVRENRCKWPKTVVCDTEPTLELSNGYTAPTLAGPVPPGCTTGKVSAAECCSLNPEWNNLHLPHESDCGLFYQCDHSQPTLKHCPTGLHFNPQLQICDWPDQAGCVSNINGSTAAPTTTEKTTTEHILISTTEAFTTEYISSTRTSNIPSTTQEISSTRTSTADDTTTSSPQFTSDNISNSEFTTQQITSTESAQTSNDDDTTTSSTWYTTKEETTKTSITENISSTLGISTTLSPPEESCDPIPVSKECLSGQIPATLCCKGVKNWQKVHLPNPINCNTYFDCITGEAILKKCPAGLHWSTISDRCEHPQDSECITITTTTHKPQTSTKHHHHHHHDDDEDDNNSSSSSSEISNECLYGRADPVKCCRGVASWRQVLLQNNKNCQSYYQCVQGWPMYRQCPKKRWWNADKGKCDNRKHATCKHGDNFLLY